MRKITTLLLLFYCFLSYAQGVGTTIKHKIYFELNSSYLTDTKGCWWVVDTLLPYIKQNEDKLASLIIVGSASPEGGELHNYKLSRNRASAVARLFPADIKEKITILGIGSNTSGDDFSQLRNAEITAIFTDTDTVAIRDTVYVDRIKTVLDTVIVEQPLREVPVLAVKTNILLDAIPYSPFGVSFTPNIQAEIFINFYGISIEGEYVFPWWNHGHKCYQISDTTVGLRKYLRSDYSGWYIGLYANWGYYDLSIDEERGWQGEFVGGGISVGWVKRMGRFRFEPYLRIGYLHSNYDGYHAGDPYAGKYYYDWSGYKNDFIKRQHSFGFVGPVMLGFNLSFDLVTTFKK